MDENSGLHPLPVLLITAISAGGGLLFGGILGAGIASVVGLAVYTMTLREVDGEPDR